MSEAPVVDAGVEYPTRDGRPVAETPLHHRRLMEAAHALFVRYDARPDVYVGVNMLVYDQRGHPKRHLSPDAFVAFGVAERELEREIYKLWEDPSPSFVLEVTSKTTREEDQRKKLRYARWGVKEYFLYDPRAEWVRPALRGFELSGLGYRAMQREILPNGKSGLHSRTLDLGLWLDGSVLRFYEPNTGKNLSTPEEDAAEAAAADERVAAFERRAAAEATRRKELEAELALLKSRQSARP